MTAPHLGILGEEVDLVYVEALRESWWRMSDCYDAYVFDFFSRLWYQQLTQRQSRPLSATRGAVGLGRVDDLSHCHVNRALYHWETIKSQ